ncbi:MAG: hypothetical protein QOD89_655 [Bradyrhizobium sp.]|jgi:hypothetical protein|nr:hypothetical protein [Bradyrhizobium sp.]
MRILGIAALCAALAGCAGTDTHLRMLENSNSLQIEPSQVKDFDYVVRMKNLVDIGYNPDNPETRTETALRAMQAQCPGARIVGEQIIEKGTYAIGRPAREYFIQIKCGPDIAPAAPPRGVSAAQQRTTGITTASLISCPDGSTAASQEICAATITEEPQRRRPATQPTAAVRVAPIQQTPVGSVSAPISAPAQATSAAPPPTNDRREAAVLSAVAIAALIVKESRNRYYATGRPCACPDDRMRNGHACGGRSAYSRPGGAQPLCYPSDVPTEMISSYRARVSQQ